ncbi:MAG TPA: hypothetical protein VIN09_12170, partial [Chloroflexota bacterium]
LTPLGELSVRDRAMTAAVPDVPPGAYTLVVSMERNSPAYWPVGTLTVQDSPRSQGPLVGDGSWPPLPRGATLLLLGALGAALAAGLVVRRYRTDRR